MKNFLTIALLLAALAALGQDRIVKRNGEIISGTVVEIGSAEIKYRYPDRPAITFSIDNALVDRVEFATGEVITVEENTFDKLEYYTNQNQRALKFCFLSPIYSTMELSYEQNIKPGRSWEAALGVIGLGFDPNERNPGGIYGKFAYKFARTPDYYMHRMHYAHILKGAYIAPEIAIRYAEYNVWDNNLLGSNTRQRITDFNLAFHLKLGKQWVFDDRFLVDTYYGIGYGSTNQDFFNMVHYGFAVYSAILPLSVSYGVRLGYLF